MRHHLPPQRLAQPRLTRELVDHHQPLMHPREHRLPEPLRRTHDQWVDPRLQPAHRARITAIAEGLLRRGETVGGVERLLRSWGVAHGLIHDGIVAALDALEEPDDTSAWLSLR